MQDSELVFPMRSALFVPANSWRFLLSSIRSDADVLIVDLEDAVPMDDKETGRWFVKEFLEKERSGFGRPVFVRVNSVASGLYREDLAFSVRPGLDGVMIPKVESADDVLRVEEVVERLEGERGLDPGTVKIVPLIESARGVENSHEIARASKRLVALAFGAGDFLRDLGISLTGLSAEQLELLYARSKVVTAAAAAGLQAIDTPFLGLIIDREGVKREAELARRLGFRGKLAIHPSHVPVLNEVFMPSQREVKEALEIVKVYEEAARRGLGATSYRGRMIDYMNYSQAKKLLSIARSLGLLPTSS